MREVTEVGLDYRARTNDGRQSLPLATVDPGDYAALAGRTDLGAFPAGELRRPDGAAGGAEDAVLPALASPAVAERFGGDFFRVRLADGSTATLRIALVRDAPRPCPATTSSSWTGPGCRPGRSGRTYRC